MRTARQNELDRAVARALSQMREIPLDEPLLADSVMRAVAPRATLAEAQESISHLESRGFLAGLPGETCIAWALTLSGRSWWTQNR